MNAVVPAAGEGTRLRPLTSNMPKGLVRVHGRPLLTYVFDRLLAHDVDAIVVVTGYHGEAIERYFGEVYAGTPLIYRHQPERRGLADAVRQTDGAVSDPFLLLNGDNVFLDDLPPMRERASESDGALLVEHASAADRAEGGAVRTDNGRVVEVTEKPDAPRAGPVTTGCYLLPAAITAACAAINPSSRGEYELADAINHLIEAGAEFLAIPSAGHRINVNTPADLHTAEDALDH